MTTSINEKTSSKERKDIWADLQSLRQDTQALRTEVYRLRTAGLLDTTTNESLRAQQTELERRGEAIIKQYVHFICRIFGPDLENAQTFARTRMDGRGWSHWTVIGLIRYVTNILPF